MGDMDFLQTLQTTMIGSSPQVPYDPLYISDLPDVMDKKGWKNSAQLMRRWFSIRPAYKMSLQARRGENSSGGQLDYRTLPSTQVDTQIIKMSWAMGYEPVKKAFAQLKQREYWATMRGLELLRKRLTDAGWKTGGNCRIGYDPTGKLIDDVLEIEMTSQINYCNVGSVVFDKFDDFYGAVNISSLKIAVAGAAYFDAKRNKDIFKIDSFAFYLRDTYDFNDDPNDKVARLASWFNGSHNAPGLGVWSKERGDVLGKSETIDFYYHGGYKPSQTYRELQYLTSNYPSYSPVRNEDFRAWQDARNEGGDYFVFSDVHFVMPSASESEVIL
jgi:hypothetical protein